MRAMIILRFPEQRTFSPERIVLPHSYGLPTFADVRYPTVTAEAFAGEHADTQVEFRQVLLPQAAMVQALQSGNVRVVWEDQIWKVQTSEQEDDNSLTLTCERERDYVPPDSDAVGVGMDEAQIGDDTPVLKVREAMSNG